MFGESYAKQLTGWEDLDRLTPDGRKLAIAKDILADLTNRAEALSAHGQAVEMLMDHYEDDTYLLEGLAAGVMSFRQDVAEARARIIEHRIIAPGEWGTVHPDFDPDSTVEVMRERAEKSAGQRVSHATA